MLGGTCFMKRTLLYALTMGAWATLFDGLVRE